MILCFLLNGLSFCCILTSKNFFNPVNVLILNLGIVDCTYASLIPFYVQQFKEENVQQTKLGCQVSYLLDVTCMIVIAFTIMGLSLERYLFVSKKEKLSDREIRQRARHTLLMLVFLWSFAIRFAIFKTLHISIEVHNDSPACYSSLNKRIDLIYTCLKWFMAFFLPYTLIITFSVLLLKFLREWSMNSKYLSKNLKPSQSRIKSPEFSKLLDSFMDNTNYNSVYSNRNYMAHDNN
jgi:hypothetical protein